MKATKIIGAVLGVLLVAALFTGAAAAAPGDEIYLGDVYAYKLYDATIAPFGTALPAAFNPANTTWNDANGNEVTFVQDPNNPLLSYIDGKDLVEGVYSWAILTGETYSITVKQPTATVNAAVYTGGTAIPGTPGEYIPVGAAIAELIDGTADVDKFVRFTAGNGATKLMFTGPNDELGDKTFAGVNFDRAALPGNAVSLSGVDLGIWKVQAVFENDGNNYASLAPREMYGKEYFFTIIKADKAKKLSTTSDSVIQGNKATVTLTAPFGDWAVFAENGRISTTQKGVRPLVIGADTIPDPLGLTWPDLLNTVVVHVGTSGTATFAVESNANDDIKVNLYDNVFAPAVPLTEQGKLIKTLNIKVVSGAVSAKVSGDSTSVNIGNEIDLEGTNDMGGSLYLFIKGTNYEFQPIYNNPLTWPVSWTFGPANLVSDNVETVTGKEWTYTLDTATLRNSVGQLAGVPGKRPDAGSYTIYVASLTADGINPVTPTAHALNGAALNVGSANENIGLELRDLDNTALCNGYATISVAFKQPFITLTKAPEVIVKGEKAEIIGNAEGTPSQVQWYIFGTNYFGSNTVGVTDGEFTITLNGAATDQMAAGQYFLVVQHPMYDGNFNIAPVGKEIVLNKNGRVTGITPVAAPEVVLFNTDNRQSANAAQALCDALDSQDIDDMYVKASFVVAGPTSYVDTIPSQITKGQVLTVSGTTTGHKDEIVTVELLSTAFAAVPKEAVGSASFIALTTKIGDDGKWTISFDTSSLNADEYTCSVAVGQLDATTSKISIVEGSTPVNPTQTTGPVTPTAQPTAQPTATPATPGFGALAALAGLGAVAVLLLRRQ